MELQRHDVLTQSTFPTACRAFVVHTNTASYDVTTAYGYNDVFDDPSMGWSRYAHTMRIFVFNSGCFYVRATLGGLRAMVATAEFLETKGGWDQAVFNEVSSPPSPPSIVAPNPWIPPHWLLRSDSFLIVSPGLPPRRHRRAVSPSAFSGRAPLAGDSVPEL